jgi:hypothetical protein
MERVVPWPAQCGLMMPMHLIEQPPAQIVRFRQMAEAADCRLVRDGTRPRSTRRNRASPPNR